MTKEQFEHYIIGGKFRAVYNPVEQHDLSKGAKTMIGREVAAYQNMLICPIQDDKWNGQHCFNADGVHGWFPEEDIKIIENLPDVIDNVSPLPQYMYKIYYNTQEAIDANFGKTDFTPPFCAARNFSGKMDDYVMGLSTEGHQADKIERAIWYGMHDEKIVYEVMYEKPKPEHIIENHDEV